MKHSLLLRLGLAALLLFPGAAVASTAPARPVAALFYPNEIHLTVEERIKPESIPGKGQGLKVILPANASRATFFATVNDSPANGFYWLDPAAEPVPRMNAADGQAEGENAERQTLLDAIKSIRTEIDRKNAGIKARKTRLALWENLDPNAEKFKTDDIMKLDAAYAERLAALYAEESLDARELEELQVAMSKAQKKLQAYDAANVRNVAVIPFSGPENKPAFVRYSYIMPGSSRASYRLTAYPAKDLLRIEQDVTLSQNSGGTWTDVEVYISTTRRDTSIRPSVLTPWQIGLTSKDTPPPAPRRNMMAEPMAQMSQAFDMKEASQRAPAPVQEEMGTFRLWSLGRKTIDNNVAVTLPLAKDDYTASYHYTIQPSVNPKGFLTASLSLDKALELPQGKARLFVDDVAIGEQTLSINGSKATLFFGTDPQVSATMRDVKRSTGETGFISKEQNMLWHWEIIVRNTRGRAVDVWVEDPLPDEQDTAIKLTVESKPTPEKTVTAAQLGATKVYRWKFTLQPNEARTIEHKVTVAAPADKILLPGRSR
ncbi:conserved exported hypothetical protein [uncultured delta proteobacterium]|uniref:DUF4139 domain-containing protein n=1 Tax=uncultured delta proteobacterium TaxID=34034 RepID=A0A212J245_9DELT|nr:conserved exported hypothetical protein [uncultured delta proteobacterium]